MGRPRETACSMEGSSNDQMEAAIMTPDEKPKKERCSQSGISVLKKKTIAEPAAVIKNVKAVAAKVRKKTDMNNTVDTSL